MSEFKRVLLLLLIMATACFLAVGATITALYRAAFEEEETRLLEMARSQTRLIEAVARFDSVYSNQDYPGGSRAATLSQIADAYGHYSGPGKTGELVLGKREGDFIYLLVTDRPSDASKSKQIPFASEIAEPMRRALSGHSGAIVGLDYHGVSVLAGYDYVEELNLGLVAKIEVAEIRAPFVRAGTIALGSSLLLVLAGSVLFIRVSRPMIRKLEAGTAELSEANERLTQEVHDRKQAEEQLREAKTGLEARVRERTEDLSSANEALENEIAERKASGDALRLSEKRFRGMIDAAPDSIVIVSREGDILHVNEQTEALFGYEKGELLGQPHDILLPDRFREDHTKHRAQYFSEPGLRPMGTGLELAGLRKDGSEFPLEISLSPLETAEGVQVISTVREVTDRKRHERMREGQNLVLRLLATGSDLTEVLETLVRTMEALIDGMLGSVLLLSSDGTRLEHGAAPSLPEAYNQAIDGIEIGPGVGSCGTAAHEKRQVIVEDIHTDPLWSDFRDLAEFHNLHACWSQPILASAGHVLGTFAMYWREPHRPTEEELALIESAAGMASVAIESRQTEEALSRRFQEMTDLHHLGDRITASLSIEQVVESALDNLVHTTQSDMVALFLAREEQLDLQGFRSAAPDLDWAEEGMHHFGQCLCGLAWSEGKAIYSRNIHADHRCTLDECKSAGIHSLTALPLQGREGVLGVLVLASLTDRDFGVQGTYLETLANLVAGALQNALLHEELKGYADELEERVKDRTAELTIAKDRAEEADRLKSAFLATMSHELRTPLNSIIGFTGILLQGLVGPLNDEQQKQLNMVKESSRHLLDLINDVLDISKIEAGQLEIDSKPFDIREAVRKTVEKVTPMAEKKGLTLVTKLSADLGQVTSDRRRVEQVLINLVNNAVKFTEEGEVQVECVVRGDQVVTHVRDTGIGIRPEDRELLFEAFQQIDMGLNRRHEGTGLGLSICKKLMYLLGGEIRAESPGPGKGSDFSFTLPMNLAPPSGRA